MTPRQEAILVLVIMAAVIVTVVYLIPPEHLVWVLLGAYMMKYGIAFDEWRKRVRS